MNETLAPANGSGGTDHESSVNFLKIFTLISYSLVWVLGVTGNGLVIYVAGFKLKKTVNTIWFLNLAVADFLFTFFLIIGIVHVSRDYYWPFGDFMCKFYSFLFMLNMFASVFLLTAISLDRCLSTWLVVWAQNHRTLIKARITCFLIWLLAIFCSLPYTIHREIKHYGNFTICHSDITHSQHLFLVLFRLILAFVIPLIIIIICYMATGLRIRRLPQKSMKPFKMILIVILAFFVCWLPLNIFRFLYWASKNAEGDHYLGTLLNLVSTLAYFNSCLNPFLYVFMTEEFKKKLKQSLVTVFESAFAEDHLFQRLSHSFSHHKSHSQDISQQDDTQTSVLDH